MEYKDFRLRKKLIKKKIFKKLKIENVMLKMGIISNFIVISYSFSIKNCLIHLSTMCRSKIIEFTVKLKISEIKY